MPPDIEKIKREGVELNVNRLAWQGYKAVSPEDHYRLKTQGVCSQRQDVKKNDGRFMLRIKIPFGQVRTAQLRTLAEITRAYGRGWGHLTTRQGMELHDVRLEDVPTVFEMLESAGLTTKAACGDTIRNVVTCAHTGEPVGQGKNSPLLDIRPWALLVQKYFLELGPENLNLPRKMNVYMTGCADCIGHARINDLGLVAATRRKPDGTVETGFGLWVGGGLGANPRLAQQLRSFLSFDEVLPALEAVVRLYITHGSRKSRATSKLKFLIEEWGMGRFSQEFEKYYAEIRPRFNSVPLPLVRHTSPKAPPSALRREVSVLIGAGEIRAEALESMAELCGLFGEGQVFFTKEQNISFKNLLPNEADNLTAALQAAGFTVEGAGRIDDVLACPGTDFCPVATTPSLSTGDRLSRQLRELVGQLSPELQKLRIHISGCPNSCAQHQVADIGLSGTRVHIVSAGQSGLGYQLFLGGTMESTGKLALLVHYGIPSELIVEVILGVLACYEREKQPHEEFSCYIGRIGQETWEDRLENMLESLRQPELAAAAC